MKHNEKINIDIDTLIGMQLLEIREYAVIQKLRLSTKSNKQKEAIYKKLQKITNDLYNLTK